MFRGSSESERPTHNCSFCGRKEIKVETLIAGPGVYICNECVEFCNEIIEEERKPLKGRV